MLPRLQAQEKLSTIHAAAFAAGGGEPLDRERILEDLRRKAAGLPDPAPVKADPADLAAMGIGVKEADGEAAVITDLNAWLGNTDG